MIEFIIIVLLVIALSVAVYFVFHYKARAEKAQSAQPPALASGESLIRPRNGRGEAVDWFFVLKLPYHGMNCNNDLGSCSCADCSCSKPSNCDNWDEEKRKTGQCYYYADSNHPTLTYYTALGFGCLSDDNSPLQQTMSSLQSGKWAIWNDQGETKSCSPPHAHSKGAVSYNARGGWIMSTSSPHWPNTNLQPMGCQADDNVVFSQHVFCFAASSDDIDTWVATVPVASLCVTESSFWPTKPLPIGTTPSPISIRTLSGTPITVMVKGAGTSARSVKSGPDYYSPWSLPAQTLGVNLQVASWTSTTDATSGWGDAPNYQGGTQSLQQIIDVNTPQGCFYSVFSYSHSKWAISSGGDWVVVGDMNQQNTQAERGGLFYGFENQQLHDSLAAFISKTVDH